MKMRTLVPAIGIGAFLYMHFQNGGEMSFDSFRDTARRLFGRAKRRASELKDQAERAAVHDVATNVADATEQPAR